MIELVLVISVVLLLITAGLMVLWVPWQFLLTGGFGLIGVGLLLGIPTGLTYHILLRRYLLKNRTLPDRWWLNPTQYHDQLQGPESQRILVYFYSGAIGFFLILGGAFVVMLGVIRFW